MLSSNAVIEFTRIYLASFYTFAAFFYAIRIIYKQRKTEQKMIFSGTMFSSAWRNHFIFKGFRMTIWMVCLLRYFLPQIDHYLGFIQPLSSNSFIVLSGTILLSGSFLFVVVSHFAMGSAWRSRIDPKNPHRLKTDGLYKYSRNPIFLRVVISQ